MPFLRCQGTSSAHSYPYFPPNLTLSRPLAIETRVRPWSLPAHITIDATTTSRSKSSNHSSTCYETCARPLLPHQLLLLSRLSRPLLWLSGAAAAWYRIIGEFIPRKSPSASGPTLDISSFFGPLPHGSTQRLLEFGGGDRQKRPPAKSLCGTCGRGMASNKAPISYARTYFERK